MIFFQNQTTIAKDRLTRLCIDTSCYLLHHQYLGKGQNSSKIINPLMSEILQLLRYEIPSLFLFIELFWAITCFMDAISFVRLLGIEYKDISAILTAFMAFLVIISVPIGWFLYQVYDAIYKPHYRKNSISLLKKEIDLPLGVRAKEASNHEELLDMLLFDDKFGSETAAAHPAASRRGIQGAAA